MTSTPHSTPAQPAIDAVAAITTARRDRFPNLCEGGILGRRHTGQPINPADVAVALAFLGRCRRTKRPNTHTADLQRHVGVGPGAIIAAGVCLNFEVRGWYGIREFYPHAVMGVNRFDVRRQVTA
jgi:hypothetical protein